MKKILAIALALVLGLSAVSSLALVDGGTSGDKFVWTDVALSQQYAVASVAGVASTLADPATNYRADQAIYGVLKLDYNADGSGSASLMEFEITSDNVTFPSYMNTPGTLVIHYTDKFGLVRTPGATTQAAQPAGVSDIKNDTTKNLVTITFDAAKVHEHVGTLNNYALNGGKAQPMYNFYPDMTGAKKMTTDSGSHAPKATFYLGFQGLVKDGGTATTGTINAAMRLAAGAFSNGPRIQVDIQPNLTTMGTVSGGGLKPSDFGVATPTEAFNFAQSIDVYENGQHVYRILKLRHANAAGNFVHGNEYLIQQVVGRDTSGNGTVFAAWAIGIANTANNAQFHKITYRKNMPTTYYTQAAANFNTAVVNGVGANQQSIVNTGMGALLAQAFLDPAAANMDVAAEVINGYVEASGLPGTNGYLVPQVNSPSIAYLYNPIMNYFGFSFAYKTALEDKHFQAKAGLSSSKTVTFNYFGVPVEEPDDDIDVPQTGDGSASVLVVLGASAILAAAALAFVMKKARD